jgi:hypothetical protein
MMATKYWLLVASMVLSMPTALAQETVKGSGSETPSDDSWGDDNWSDDSWTEEQSGNSWHGFIEAGLGGRLQEDTAVNEQFSALDDTTLADLRLRLETTGFIGDNRYALKADLYADGVEQGVRVDLREASYTFSASENTDVKLGQQILTWGTGDLVFLNDLFAKDWQSFFAGRDTEYLKAPVAAAKASYYGESASLELVWIPVFTSDRYINGERFSWFSPKVGENVAAPSGRIDAKDPANSFANGEFAARIAGSVDSTEWALYGYRGFQKQPNALDVNGQPVFTRLDVLGASVRGNLGTGLANAEVALHMSEDGAGNDPMMPNDQFRFLLGYEREILPKLTLGLQYYLEQTLDYSALTDASASAYSPAQYRYLYTTRLNYRMWQDNLTWSLFAFYSPSDDDHFIRPSVTYRYSDNLNMVVGANLFGGEKAHTFFGQFEDASNVYGRIRYAF